MEKKLIFQFRFTGHQYVRPVGQTFIHAGHADFILRTVTLAVVKLSMNLFQIRSGQISVTFFLTVKMPVIPAKVHLRMMLHQKPGMPSMHFSAEEASLKIWCSSSSGFCVSRLDGLLIQRFKGWLDFLTGSFFIYVC